MSNLNIAADTAAVKAELDRLEFVERVPELQPDVTTFKNRVIVLPHHPAVFAYVIAQAAVPRPETDLRTARHHLKNARQIFIVRSHFRVAQTEWIDPVEGPMSVSLSAIIEARAEATHWRDLVERLERAAKREKQYEQNRRAIVRHRLRKMGLAC